jgi:ABC-type antimicrobial peptide transport system permease subunit
MIARNIITLIIISLFTAMPVIYLVADNWLNKYHYRIHPGWMDYSFGFAVALIIAIATISYRAVSAARANPAISLKYE